MGRSTSGLTGKARADALKKAGELLRTWRVRAGFETVPDLQRHLGRPEHKYRWISSIENGYSALPKYDWFVFARAFRMDPKIVTDRLTEIYEPFIHHGYKGAEAPVDAGAVRTEGGTAWTKQTTGVPSDGTRETAKPSLKSGASIAPTRSWYQKKKSSRKTAR